METPETAFAGINAFAQLIEALDSTNKTNEKVALLATYFRTAPQNDALWAVALLSHRRPSRPVSTSLLREWAAELAGLSPWLFEEAYHIVGDLAETITLLLSNGQNGAGAVLGRNHHRYYCTQTKRRTGKEKLCPIPMATTNKYGVLCLQ